MARSTAACPAMALQLPPDGGGVGVDGDDGCQLFAAAAAAAAAAARARAAASAAALAAAMRSCSFFQARYLVRSLFRVASCSLAASSADCVELSVALSWSRSACAALRAL